MRTTLIGIQCLLITTTATASNTIAPTMPPMIRPIFIPLSVLSCEGSLTFDPLSQTLSCKSCGSTFGTEEIDETSGLNFKSKKWVDGEAFPYRCPSCGAEVIYGKEDTTARCTYCGSDLVLGHNLSGIRRPDIIIPFKIDEKATAGAVWSTSAIQV